MSTFGAGLASGMGVGIAIGMGIGTAIGQATYNKIKALIKTGQIKVTDSKGKVITADQLRSVFRMK